MKEVPAASSTSIYGEPGGMGETGKYNKRVARARCLCPDMQGCSLIILLTTLQSEGSALLEVSYSTCPSQVPIQKLCLKWYRLLEVPFHSEAQFLDADRFKPSEEENSHPRVEQAHPRSYNRV
jgi:hypothetical protein